MKMQLTAIKPLTLRGQRSRQTSLASIATGRLCGVAETEAPKISSSAGPTPKDRGPTSARCCSATTPMTPGSFTAQRQPSRLHNLL